VQFPVYNTVGEVVKQIEISDQVFGVSFNEAVVHQVLVAQRANARQGTVDTKTRGEVKGSGTKLYRQKHTGMARAGSKRTPIRRGGGVAFGPHPKDYDQPVPRKMRRLALKCVLSTKAGGGELKILENLELAKPSTKEMAKVLTALGVDSTVLVATPEPQTNIILSARNIPAVKTMPANLLNVVDLLSYKILLMTEDAVRKVEELWGGKVAVEEKA